MSDYAGEQALAEAPGAVAQSLLFGDAEAGAGTCQENPYPREFVTLGLVVFCLSFWSLVIFSVAHSG